MELGTFGAILTFAAEWEGEVAGWYGLHTEGAQAGRLATLAAAARRREARLRRTRQEGVSEMILVPISGLDAVFLGSVTMRAGLSSSAAVEMAFGVAWQALGGWRLSCDEMAQAGREAERSYMGLGTGIQDQFTVLCAERDQAFYLDCRTLEHEIVPLPDSARVVVCDTLTRRELVGSSYNGRSADCKAAVSVIAAENASVQMLRDVPLDLLDAFQPRLSADQFRRSRHVVNEIAAVTGGRAALLAGDLETSAR